VTSPPGATHEQRATHFLRAAAAWPAPWGLAVDGTGRLLARQVTVAADSRARRTGLLGRDALPRDEALVLAPCQGIHTFGMRFPIDVVCVTRDGRVIKIVESVAPRRVVLSWRAFAIVELCAGRCREIDLAVGAVLGPWQMDQRDGQVMLPHREL
jgi:uncharacterized membrane protein (UPF0127 family)